MKIAAMSPVSSRRMSQPAATALQPFRRPDEVEPTTVGPETTGRIPSVTAAPRDMPSSGAATDAASAQVISTPV